MFKDRLIELMSEKNIKANKLSKEIDTSESVISDWKKGKVMPKLDKALKLRQFFNCSLDYLFNNIEYEDISNTKQTTTFDIQLKKILKDKKIAQTKMIDDLNLSNANLHRWFKMNDTPTMETIVKIADYLNVSIDYLVGIE